MERWPRIILTVGFLCLLAVLAGCGPTPTAIPAPSPVPATQSVYPPPPQPSPAPYPSPEPTQERPLYTPTAPPLPTLAPPTVPTATPVPTALSLPPSTFDVLWLESPSGSGVDDTGVIWRADPRDIANRREVARLNDKVIERAAISPDGQSVALVTKGRLEGGGPLWVMNVDGTGLRQLAPLARYILWGPDSRTVFYKIDESGEEGIERVNLGDGKAQRILTIEPFTSLQPVGWAPGGQWLYYIRTRSEYELWKMRQDGSDPQVVTPLDVGYPPVPVLLSPRGNKLLVGIHWLLLDSGEKGDMQLPRAARNGQVLWDSGPAKDDQAVVGQIEHGVYYLYTVEIPSQRAEEIAHFVMPVGPWYQLTLSPDHQWLVAHVYHSGFYWVHLPTGTVVSVSPYDSGTQFIAWIPKEPGP